MAVSNSQRVMNKKKAREFKLKAEEEVRRKKELYGFVFGTPEGKIVLRDILKMCGVFSHPVVANPATGEINVNSTLYNAFRQGVYLEIRKNMPKHLLNSVER